MGLYLTWNIFKGPSELDFLNALPFASMRSKWGLEPATETASSYDCLRIASKRNVHLLEHYSGWPFIRELGLILDCPMMQLRLQEGMIWDYSLSKGGQDLDHYSVCPQYWGRDVNPKEWKGKPSVLASTWDIPVHKIERYFVQWPWTRRFPWSERTFKIQGKAYPEDKCPYGDANQFFDFARVLQAPEYSELRTHSLLIKNA